VRTGPQGSYWDNGTLVITAAPGYWDCSGDNVSIGLEGGSAQILGLGNQTTPMHLYAVQRERLTRDEAAFIRIGLILEPIRTNTNEEFSKCWEQVGNAYLNKANYIAMGGGAVGIGGEEMANSIVSHARAMGQGAAAEGDALVIGYRFIGKAVTAKSLGYFMIALNAGPAIGCATYGRP
jgi:hypothetical protein